MTGTPGNKFQLTKDEQIEADMQDCPNGDDCIECGECKEARERALAQRKKKASK